MRRDELQPLECLCRPLSCMPEHCCTIMCCLQRSAIPSLHCTGQNAWMFLCCAQLLQMPLTESAHTYTLIYFKLLYVFCILFCILIVSLFACCTPHNSHVPCRCLSLPPHTSSQLLGPTSLGIETMLRSLYSARTWAFYIYHMYTFVLYLESKLCSIFVTGMHLCLWIPFTYLCAYVYLDLQDPHSRWRCP